MPSQATTVAEYLAELPPDRRKALNAIRKVIKANLDSLYKEGIQYGMIGYFVPHKVYPAGYHCDTTQPLPFVGVASQKNHMAVYLFCVYCKKGEVEWFQAAWKKTGKKLDMGKSCVRFKKLEEVALDVLGETVRRAPAKDFIAEYEAGRSGSGGTRRKAAKKKASKKKTTKKRVSKKSR